MLRFRKGIDTYSLTHTHTSTHIPGSTHTHTSHIFCTQPMSHLSKRQHVNAQSINEQRLCVLNCSGPAFFTHMLQKLLTTRCQWPPPQQIWFEQSKASYVWKAPGITTDKSNTNHRKGSVDLAQSPCLAMNPEAIPASDESVTSSGFTRLYY